jgi:hypothetical protein
MQNPQGREKIAAYAGSWSIHIEHLATPFSKAGDEHTQCGMTAGGAAGISREIVCRWSFETDPGECVNVSLGDERRRRDNLLPHGDVFSAADTMKYRQEFSTDTVKWTLMGHGLEKKAAQP